MRLAFHLTRGPVLECGSCGVFIARDESVHPDQDRGFHDTLDEAGYVGYFEAFRKGQYRKALSRLEAPEGSRLLDVGASYGWMLEVGRDLGLDCYGLEPSTVHREEWIAGRVFEQTLEEYQAGTKERYDIVTLWHVLEHFRDPFAAIRQISDLLADDGSALIAIPNASGRMYRLALFLAKHVRSGRLMEELWYTHNPNMHRYYPTLRAVSFLLENTQLGIVDSYVLDAFDWRRIWRRSTSPIVRPALKTLGPLIARSRFTSNENLIVVASKAHQ